MAKVFDSITQHHREWIAGQALFFVGTAPLAADGHVNVSPKGPIGSFAVLDDHTVAYLDVNGSGIETIGHVRENGRIVIMFCAFAGPPRILRLHGRGEVLSADAVDFGVEAPPGTERAVIRVAVERIADSCGYGVPVMTYVGERPQQVAWVDRKLRQDGTAALDRYVAEKNALSIDGLPAIDRADVS